MTMLFRRCPPSSRLAWAGSSLMLVLAVLAFGAPAAASRWLTLAVALGLLIVGPAQLLVSLRRSRSFALLTTLRGMGLGVLLSLVGWWGIGLLQVGGLKGLNQWLLVLPGLIVLNLRLNLLGQQWLSYEKGQTRSWGQGLEVFRRVLGRAGISLLPRLRIAVTIFGTLAVFFGTAILLVLLITQFRFPPSMVVVDNLLKGLSTTLTSDLLGWTLACSLLGAGLLPADFTPDPRNSL